MKIAILLCGQARYFRQGYESIRAHILNAYQPDVYIHTWASPTHTFEAAPWNKLGAITITDSDIREYIALYNPVRCKVDLALEHLDPVPDLSRTSAPQTRYNFTSYATSLKRCFALVDKPYDAFIILRSDAVIINFPRPSHTHIQVWDRLKPRQDVLDVIVCSVPAKYIGTYVSLVDWLDAYYEMGYVYNYEELYHAHFKERGLYEVTEKLPKSRFEWGYIRGSRIERM